MMAWVVTLNVSNDLVKNQTFILSHVQVFIRIHLSQSLHKVGTRINLPHILLMRLNTGIGTQGIFPGIIGEVGTSHNEIKPVENELIIGAGIAALKTGLTVTTHTTLGTMGIQQVDMLFKLGVPKEQIIIGHQDLNANKDEVLEVLRSGVYIGFDTIGKNNYRPDEERIAFLQDFIEQGFHQQILLSADLTRKSHWRKARWAWL